MHHESTLLEYHSNAILPILVEEYDQNIVINSRIINKQEGNLVIKGIETSVYSSQFWEINSIKELYWFKNDIAIVSFLKEYDFLIDFLRKSFYHIYGRFESPLVYIELVEDEEVSNWKTLVITIKSALKAQVAHEKYMDILKSWFYDQDKKIKHLITITHQSI
ncbi:MAG: hypothetical protein MI921_25680 [Cytophagales bacterium]|nr:hypothetical protein [Cytophagales bacterium]